MPSARTANEMPSARTAKDESLAGMEAQTKEAGGEVATVELTPSGAPANLGDNAPLSPQTLPPSARPGMPKQTRVHGQGGIGAGGDVSGNAIGDGSSAMHIDELIVNMAPVGDQPLRRRCSPHPRWARSPTGKTSVRRSWPPCCPGVTGGEPQSCSWKGTAGAATDSYRGPTLATRPRSRSGFPAACSGPRLCRAAWVPI